MSDIRWMTYAELAAALSITIDSGKNLVRRKRWQRQAGNDGMARVGVPLEYLMRDIPKPVDTPTDSAIDAPADAAIAPPTNPPADGAMVVAMEVLREHIARLEVELTSAKDERDRERLRGSQVEVLTAVLEIERQRTTELREERDRWAKLAEEAQRQAAARPKSLWGWLRAST